VLCGAAKTAKTASHFANVRVVYDAECGITHAIPGKFGLTYSIGGLDDFGPRDVFQNFEPFCRCEAFLSDCFI
jgi:hypothetical protein